MLYFIPMPSRLPFTIITPRKIIIPMPLKIETYLQVMQFLLNSTLLVDSILDDELPNYIMVMVANRRTKSQMNEDLNFFLSTKTSIFVNWLHIVLNKLGEVTVTLPDAYKKTTKRKSGNKNSMKPKKENGSKKVRRESQAPKSDEDKLETSHKAGSFTDNPISINKLEQSKSILTDDSVEDQTSEHIDVVSKKIHEEKEVTTANFRQISILENKIIESEHREAEKPSSPTNTSSKDEIEQGQSNILNKDRDIEFEKVSSEEDELNENEIWVKRKFLHKRITFGNVETGSSRPRHKQLSDRSPDRFLDRSQDRFHDRSPNKLTAEKKTSILDRLGKRPNSPEKKRKKIRLSQYRKDEEGFLGYSDEQRTRNSSSDSDRSNRYSSRLYRDKSKNRDRSPQRSRDKGRESRTEGIFSTVGVQSKTVVIKKLEIDYNSDEQVVRQVPSAIKVIPRVVPSDVPQPNNNLLVKAVAEGQRSIAHTPTVGKEVEPNALFTKIHKEKPRENPSDSTGKKKFPSRKLSSEEKKRLRFLQQESNRMRSSDEYDSDDEDIPKLVKNVERLGSLSAGKSHMPIPAAKVSEVSKPPIYTRLADKYDPNPKSKIVDTDIPDVDKAVSDDIENFMKVSPARPLISPLSEHKHIMPEGNILQPASRASVLIVKQPRPVQLPEILQKIFSNPLLGDLIPKRLNENTFPLTTAAQNKALNLGVNSLIQPGAIHPPEPPILSPPRRPLSFQPPNNPRNFVSPPHRQEFIPNQEMGVSASVLLPATDSQHRRLPSPPNMFPFTTAAQNKALNLGVNRLTQPGAIHPPEPPILSSPRRPLSFQSPDNPRNFVSPPHRQEFIPNQPKVAGLDTSRIKVMIKTDSQDITVNELDTIDAGLTSFASEYDKEFKIENNVKSETGKKEASKSVKKVATKQMKESNTKYNTQDVQVEEPSSSKDVIDIAEPDASVADSSKRNIGETFITQLSKGNVDVAFKKLAVSVKANSSKISDGAQDRPIESNELSEQNILTHFFENLLKSNNKKDKKTALFSLIETFSDSFDTKEIQKIRKIIKANEDKEEESDKEEFKSREKKDSPNSNSIPDSNITSHTLAVARVQEEQPVVSSTTEEVPIDNDKGLQVAECITSNEPLLAAETNEVTKSSEEIEPPPNFEVTKSEESFNKSNQTELLGNLEPVIVSVGEIINHRRRNLASSKSRTKEKTELDMLHEDIHDMFIRDGVLTATGKGICRILKDDPAALSVTNPETILEPPKKVRKKPGPKHKHKMNKDEIQNFMKDLRIVIKKMPDNIMTTGTTKQLRSRNKQSSYAESDDESQKVINDLILPHQLRSRNLQSNYLESDDDSHKSNNEIDAGLSEDDEFVKSERDMELSSKSGDEDNTTQSRDGVPKPRIFRRRRRTKWASGIIPKNKKTKFPSKSQESSPYSSQAFSPDDTDDSIAEAGFDKLAKPDKKYYYDYANRTKMVCKLCKYSGLLLTEHYLKEHPQSEILCSRLAPHVATEAIKDFSVNGKKYESIINTKLSIKYHYCCRVCGFTSVTTPIFFYEHVTTHTGEYRHQCGICEYFAVTERTMAGHFISAHPDQEKKAIRRTYTLAIVFGYICGECKFFQLKEKSVEDHANIFHLGVKSTIYKISMSTVLDSIFNNLDQTGEELTALEPELTDITISSTESEVPRGTTETTGLKTRKKSGPKRKVAVQETRMEKENNRESPVPVVRKKPSPNSKTMPIATTTNQNKNTEKVIESPAGTSTEPVGKTPSSSPVRKKTDPKSKTQKPKPPVFEETPNGDEAITQSHKEATKDVSFEPKHLNIPDESIKEAPIRKRRRSLDKLISEDSEDDLDTIITLSSRSSRTTKEKSTDNIMESNEGLSTRKKSDTDLTIKEKEKEKSQSNESIDEKEAEQAERINDLNKETREKEAVNENQTEEIHLPSIEGSSSERKGLNICTCKNDTLEEEAKQIEEERLPTMEELNKSFGSRTSKLDFVDKLINKLNNDQPSEQPRVAIKQEPKDDYLALRGSARRATPKMPVLEKELPQPVTSPPLTKISKSPLATKMPGLEENNPLPQSSINIKQNKLNSLFSSTIEKLQGKVNEAAVQQQSPSTSSPPLNEETSCNNSPRSPSPELLISIGDLISATETDSEIVYSCHANNCYVVTKDKMVFQLHCKFGHKDLTINSSLCDKCGVVIEITPDTSLLENLYDHLVFAHSDCLAKSSNLRMRRLSGDELSVKQESLENKLVNLPAKENDPQDFESALDRHVLKYLPKESTIHTATAHVSVEKELATPASQQIFMDAESSIGAAVQQQSPSTSSPPLNEETSCNKSPRSPSPELLISISDLISATERDSEIVYSCHANNCCVATKDKMVFQLHCKFGHKDLTINSSLCDKCGVVIEITPDTSLLENLYDHLVFAHSDCLAKSSNLRMRRLSGDELSVKQESLENKSVNLPAKENDPQDFECALDRHVVIYSLKESTIHTATAHVSVEEELPTPVSQHVLMDAESSIGAAVQQQSPSTSSPPLNEETSCNKSPRSPSPELLISISDLISATERDSEIVYSCNANNCCVATKDKMVFQLHCKFGHKDLTINSSLCEKCGVVIEITPDTSLLENLYDHLVFAHSDCLAKSSNLRMRRLSGDELSTPTTMPAGVEIPNEEPVALEATPDITEDNPFSFKITNVVSLAKSTESQTTLSSPINNKPMQQELPPLRPVPPLTLVGIPKQQPSVHQNDLVVKEFKLTSAELTRPKKAPKALQKFLDTPGILYKCPEYYCMFCTNVQMYLERHLKVHQCDNEVMVPCVYCDMKTPWEHVPMHINIRHATSRFACSYCLYRAFAEEYVCLHQEQEHPDQDIVVLALPSHRAAKKFSVADARIDIKILCEPFRCVCRGEDGRPVAREYLFETEFANHLNTVHKNNYTCCGYPGCNHNVNSSMMVNHWAFSHGVGSYQCAYCKTSSQTIDRIYIHFSQQHPSKRSNILVRVNDNLPKDRELGYSKEAFEKLCHIRNVPPKLLTVIGKRSQRSIKSIHFSGSFQESTYDIPESTSTASTTGWSEAMYLLPASMISPKKGQPVTSMAPISNVASQTISDSKNIVGPPGESELGIESDSSLPRTSVSAISSSNLPRGSEKIGNTSIVPLCKLTQVTTIAALSRSLPTAGSSLISQRPFATASNKNANSQLPGTPALKIVRNNFSLVPETTSTTTIKPIESRSEMLATNTNGVEHGEVSGDIPDSSILSEKADLLYPDALESNEDLNLDPPLFDDINDDHDSPPEDSLTITPTFNGDLPSANDPLNINDLAVTTDPLEASKGQGVDLVSQSLVESSPGPLSISSMQRCIQMKMVSNSDDESDSSTSDKGKKRGLRGHQLYRCAFCNRSFSNVQAFESHLISAVVYKKPGMRQYQCVHCKKSLKTRQKLVEHIQIHGIPRFSCSLCNEKFHFVGIAKLHMEMRHHIPQTVVVPQKSDSINMDMDELTLKPGQTNQFNVNFKTFESFKQPVDQNTFNPDQIDRIPIRQIFINNVTCGKCNYQTKLRGRFVKHLQMHLEEKAVPDSVPVNPVPYLEKNEIMLDKMINLAASPITTSASRVGGAIQVIEPDSHTESTPVSKTDDTPLLKDKDSKTKSASKTRGLKRQSTITALLEDAAKMAKIEEPDDEDSVMVTNCSKKHLISIYGLFGIPHNQQWKCPICHQFKSKNVGDFVFHIYKHFFLYRYKCKACSYLNITYKSMLDHIALHPGINEDIIEALVPNIKLETWIHMVIREQTLAILKNSPPLTKRPLTGPTDITCYFCQEKFMTMPDCCEHMLFHWVMLPYQCHHCAGEFYTKFELRHHHKIEHLDLKLYLDPKGPTLTRALQCIENIKKRPPAKTSPQCPSRKEAKVDEFKDTKETNADVDVITNGIVTNPKYKKRPKAATVTPSTSAVDVIRIDDDDDDLVIVTKTENTTLPNEDEVFACDA